MVPRPGGLCDRDHSAFYRTAIRFVRVDLVLALAILVAAPWVFHVDVDAAHCQERKVPQWTCEVGQIRVSLKERRQRFYVIRVIIRCECRRIKCLAGSEILIGQQ